MSDSGLERSIFRFILRYSKRDQIYLTVMTAISFPILYYTLELPKIIINQAIGGTEFPRLLFGVELEQIEFLLALCFAFLGLVLVNGGLKYHVNVYRGRLGERMLRRLRFELYSRVMRFPLPHFKRMSSGEIIPMITSEVEPLGGFIGDALALPMLQGGTLATYMFFIFVQDFWLGLAAIALYPFQIYLIPKLQRRVNLLAKERVRTVRKLADRVGESVSAATEVHANDASRLLRADVSHRLNRIYDIRYEIFRRKFFIKFLNNFLGQLTPFFFYSIGGYFVIRGELSFGALVAVIAAYKDLASPWKELLDFYQIKEDARIKYEQVVEQFAPDGMMAPDLQYAEPEKDEPLEGDLAIANLRLSEDGHVFQLDGVTFTMRLDEHVALVGPGGSGRSELTQVLARLVFPTAGSINVDGHRLVDLPEAVTGRRLAYVGPSVFMFSSTVFNNLTFGLKHRPRTEPEYEGEAKDHRATYVHEATLTANLPDDLEADWIDYGAAGASGPEDLIARIEDALRLVELDGDIYGFGLRGTIDPQRRPEIADRFLDARRAMRERLSAGGAQALVEPFDIGAYNTNASLAENLLFGTPTDNALSAANLATNEYVKSVLESEGLTADLLRVGYRVAETMVEIFSDLPPGHEFFSLYSFIDSEELPDYQAIVSRVSLDSLDELGEAERDRLMALPFYLIERRHRLGLIDDEMKARILRARRAFADNLPEGLAGAIEFFDESRYNAAASIQDNILFGKLAHGQAQAEAKVGSLLSEVIDEMDLRDAVIEVGLDYEVGIGGSRLSTAQRQKLALARGLLKRPDLLIVDEATAPLDSAAQQRILDAVLAVRDGRGVVWSLHRAGLARRFGRVIVMASGRVVEDGAPADLEREGTEYSKLVASE